jgi:hypothetical protein
MRNFFIQQCRLTNLWVWINEVYAWICRKIIENDWVQLAYQLFRQLWYGVWLSINQSIPSCHTVPRHFCIRAAVFVGLHEKHLELKLFENMKWPFSLKIFKIPSNELTQDSFSKIQFNISPSFETIGLRFEYNFWNFYCSIYIASLASLYVCSANNFGNVRMSRIFVSFFIYNLTLTIT